MQKVEYQNNVDSKIKKIYTKKHHDTIEDLEKLLEKGVPNLTMSEIASRLKISLRTLYEIAPSKDQLILMTMDKILIKLGKFALDSVSEIQSPIEKLEQYLFIVNQAVGPKFNTFLKDIEKINGSQKMADYHESFISNYTQKLLNDAIKMNEIENIDKVVTINNITQFVNISYRRFNFDLFMIFDINLINIFRKSNITSRLI